MLHAVERRVPRPVSLPNKALAGGVLTLTDKQRGALLQRMLFLRPIQALMECGVKRRPACQRVLGQLKRGELPAEYVALAQQVGRKGKPPSEGTVMRWLAEADSSDPTALAPKQTGRRKVAEGWEAAAERLYSRMQNPSAYSVYEDLQKDFPSITYNKVNRYLNNLPATRGKDGPARVGKHFHKTSRDDYRERDLSNLRPGEIWQGDGHRVDVYMQHPATGRIWRPELTAWIDVVSRYIVGWYLAENESTITTNFALCHALQSSGHRPLFVHVDNGSGFAARTMRDEHVGLYRQLDIEPMFAIPGNPKAKGHIERWFLTMEGKFGKKWDTYCGPDMAPEANRRISAEVKSGRRQLPTLQQYVEGLREWIDWYHQRPHRGLDGRTPADVWAERTPNPVPNMDVIHLRERAVSKVFRQRVRLHNRHYKHPILAEFEGREVVVEYWLHDDATLRVLDKLGREVCVAPLVHKDPYLSDSRLEERRQSNIENQRRRAQAKLDDVEDRARGVLAPSRTAQALDHIGALTVDHDDFLEHAPAKAVGLLLPTDGDAEPDYARLDITDTPLDDEDTLPRQRLDIANFDLGHTTDDNEE